MARSKASVKLRRKRRSVSRVTTAESGGSDLRNESLRSTILDSPFRRQPLLRRLPHLVLWLLPFLSPWRLRSFSIPGKVRSPRCVISQSRLRLTISLEISSPGRRSGREYERQIDRRRNRDESSEGKQRRFSRDNFFLNVLLYNVHPMNRENVVEKYHTRATTTHAQRYHSNMSVTSMISIFQTYLEIMKLLHCCITVISKLPFITSQTDI